MNKPKSPPSLNSNLRADVCVVGAGIAGISAALELVQSGLSVVLLESDRIGEGASGLSGGQVMPGYACGMTSVRHHLGAETARTLWQLSVDGVEKIKERIRAYQIECQWTAGVCQGALKPEHLEKLSHWKRWAEKEYSYAGLQWLEKDALKNDLDSDLYYGGLYDPSSGHMQVRDYVLGLARVLVEKGGQIFENSPVLKIERGSLTKVVTRSGEVQCRHVVLAAGMGNRKILRELGKNVSLAYVYMAGTEPMGEARARGLIKNNMAVFDTKLILDFYRLSADHRLFFGGEVSYLNHPAEKYRQALRARILKVFPQLKDLTIESVWKGPCDMTVNRLPDIGCVDGSIYYIQGLSGHGLNVGTVAASAVAQDIQGSPLALRSFSKISHGSNLGGAWGRQLMTSYHYLRDRF